MSVQAFSSILSSAGIKLSSMLMVVVFAKHMSEEGFGLFSYGFSMIVTLATFISYAIGQTWGKLGSENKSKKLVAPLVIFWGGLAFTLSVLITFWAGYPVNLILIVSLSSVLAMLSYSGQFVSLYLGRYKFALLSSSAAVLLFVLLLIVLAFGLLKLNHENAFVFLVVFYLVQAPAWLSLLSVLSNEGGKAVGFRWVSNVSAKYATLSLMGAPVHFLCLTMLALYSGVNDVGSFNLSFQLYVATIFCVASLQPVMLKSFAGKGLSRVGAYVLFSIIVVAASVFGYWFLGQMFSCSDISLLCLDEKVVAMPFVCALLAGNNTILMQYINANYDPSVNIKLQAFYACLYFMFSVFFLWYGLGVTGLYAAIIVSSLLLLIFQILAIRRMADEYCSTGVV
ncbi:hypothetical protein [Alcanivorax sp.]|uniref:hypothetical protein n=1 Tax=Alcanivorax sp. TaxID=1872427 RepID=UPI0025B810FA|nr:hypothetical protein [Alcanivorax sp.]